MVAWTMALMVFSTLSPAEAPGSDEAKRVLGSWVVSRVLVMAPVTALTSVDAKAIVGSTVTYSPSNVRYGKTFHAVRKYTRRVLTADEFLIENRLALGKIGVTGPKVIELTAEGVNESMADQFGTFLYIVKDDVVVVAFNGVYFELRRAEHGQPNSSR